MCGIAGVYDTSGVAVDSATLGRMCDVMAHRGPDGEGAYASAHVALGHRRLAIIDLSAAGDQPMANEDGSVVIVYNGEVYNFQKLRVELAAKGHTFASRTDTEVILHGYEEWGADVVHHLNGMFAFAIWDAAEDRVFIARDRYGIKPLYYAFDGDRFIFGSEVKSVLQAYPWRGQVDRGAMLEYFTFQNIFSDRTLFEGVRLLPAAHFAFVRRGDRTIRTQRYWDFTFATDGASGISLEEAKEELRRIVESSIVRQLVSDVPLGSYLSGGMDSGSLVAVASRAIPHLMTFTGGFDVSLATGIEQNFDEREAAEQMAGLFHTDHYEMVMHGGSMERVLPKLIWHLEDLRVGMSYQNYYIAHLASKFVRVVLSGGGGDEMFAGYPWRYLPLLSTTSLSQFETASYDVWQRLVPESSRAAFFTDEALASFGDYSTFDVARDVFEGFDDGGGEWGPLQALNREMYFEAKTFLHGLLLVEDKISSAHALEARVPFLDNELVDFAAQLPPQYKLNVPGLLDGSANLPSGTDLRTSDGKYVLRSAMQGLIPDAILQKQKQGFSTPDGSWYRSESMRYIQDLLLAPRCTSRGYFRPEFVRGMLEEHASGVRNHRLLIWSLLSFEHWNRIFVDREQGFR